MPHQVVSESVDYFMLILHIAQNSTSQQFGNHPVVSKILGQAFEKLWAKLVDQEEYRMSRKEYRLLTYFQHRVSQYKKTTKSAIERFYEGISLKDSKDSEHLRNDHSNLSFGSGAKLGHASLENDILVFLNQDCYLIKLNTNKAEGFDSEFVRDDEISGVLYRGALAVTNWVPNEDAEC